MNLFGDLTPRPVPTPIVRKTLTPASDRLDAKIIAFWNDDGLNTLEIARKLCVRECLVANRLAVIRDGRAA